MPPLHLPYGRKFIDGASLLIAGLPLLDGRIAEDWGFRQGSASVASLATSSFVER
jgi:hypothetical protein